MKKIITFFFLFGTVALGAQELKVSSGQAPQQAVFAQPFTLTYTVEHEPNAVPQLQEESLSSDFAIQHQQTTTPTPSTTDYQLTVFPFALGKSTFTATFTAQSGEKMLSQEAQPVYITVKPASTFRDKDLREIRAPQAPYSWWIWLWILLALAALFCICYVWYKRLQEKPLHVVQPEDHRPADEIALSKIDALLNSGLWEQKQYKIFYITLSDILREYLWRRFQLDTFADTSAELLRRAKYKQHLLPLLYPLKDFLNSSDLVKFANVTPEEAVRNKDIQILREIITETSPKEIVPTPQEDAK